MGENLVAGILKNIEKLASINVNQNVSILTSINKTNILLSEQIGKELRKQTNILQTIATALTKGTFVKITMFDKKSGFGELFKGGGKNVSKIALSLDTLTKSVSEFAKAVSEIDENKFKLFVSIFDLGKKILLFATLVALAAPLLLLGLLTTLPLLFLWVKFFNWVGSSSKKINKGIKLLLFMALATAIITLTVVMAAMALGSPLKTFMAFLVVAGSMLLLSGAFYLLSLIAKPIKTGIKTMLLVALTTAILVAIVVAASHMLGSPQDTLIAFGLMAGSILALAGAMYVVSLIKGKVVQGAIAMIISAAAIGILMLAMIQFSKANVSWEDLAMVGALVVGLGAAMALAGVGALFIAAGAGAMLLAGGALYLITASLVNFKKAKWEESDNDLLHNTITGILNTFKEVFSNITFTEFAEMMAGSALLASIGNSLTWFAKGLSGFTNLEFSSYQTDSEGNIIGSKKEGTIDPAQVAKSITTMINAVSEPLRLFGEANGESGFFTDGPIKTGIMLLGNLGNSLSQFAEGISGFANMEFVEYTTDDKGNLVPKGKTKGKIDPQAISNGIQMMISATTKSIEELGGKGGGWFSSTDYETGLDMLQQLGDPIYKIAETAKTLSAQNIDSKKVGDKIKNTLGTFIGIFNTKKFENFDVDKADEVIELFGDFTENAAKMKKKTAESTGDMFVKMKDSINSMDLKKLNKLNDLAYNLSAFAENMEGSFGDLEKVLDRLVDVVKEMNGIDIKVAGAGSNTQGASNGEIKLDLEPLIIELDEIKSVLLAGIEVEVKDNTLSI